MELDVYSWKVRLRQLVDFFIYPIDLTFEYRNAAKYKVFVVLAVRVSRLINIEQMHRNLA